MKTKFTKFILKHQDFYNDLSKEIKKEISELDFYVDEIISYNKPGEYSSVYFYIGEKNNKNCLLYFNYDILKNKTKRKIIYEISLDKYYTKWELEKI